MYSSILSSMVLGAFALTATGTPISAPNSTSFNTRDNNFNLYMVQMSTPQNVYTGETITMSAPFYESGMRLSGHGEWPMSEQWNPQALFEFGYSSYAGQEGTAYDLSVMQGSDGDIGIGAWPTNGACEGKICFPWDCAPSEGWTNPDQANIGSPADTVCYHGMTDFTVVFCP